MVRVNMRGTLVSEELFSLTHGNGVNKRLCRIRDPVLSMSQLLFSHLLI